MKNPNRAMFELTGLIVGDTVEYKGKEWEVGHGVMFPDTDEFHCVFLERKADGGVYSASAWKNELSEIKLKD